MTHMPTLDQQRSALPATGVVLAIKEIERAKSRMAELTPALRRRLVTLMLLDTVAAWEPVVDRVVVVSGSPLLGAALRRAGLEVTLLPDPGTDINAALTVGVEWLMSNEPHIQRMAACVADLPTMTPKTVTDVLAAGSPGSRWMASDQSGEGTTILVADGCPLDPLFEYGSASRHLENGVRLIDAPAAARCDVDDLTDLNEAHRLGLGQHTCSLFDGAELVTDARPITVAEATDEGWSVIDDAGRRLRLPADAAPAPRLASGQRLHATIIGDRVHSAWW